MAARSRRKQRAPARSMPSLRATRTIPRTAVLSELPDRLVEMVLISPVVELTRRWLVQPKTMRLRRSGPTLA